MHIPWEDDFRDLYGAAWEYFELEASYNFSMIDCGSNSCDEEFEWPCLCRSCREINNRFGVFLSAGCFKEKDSTDLGDFSTELFGGMAALGFRYHCPYKCMDDGGPVLLPYIGIAPCYLVYFSDDSIHDTQYCIHLERFGFLGELGCKMVFCGFCCGAEAKFSYAKANTDIPDTVNNLLIPVKVVLGGVYFLISLGKTF